MSATARPPRSVPREASRVPNARLRRRGRRFHFLLRPWFRRRLSSVLYERRFQRPANRSRAQARRLPDETRARGRSAGLLRRAEARLRVIAYAVDEGALTRISGSALSSRLAATLVRARLRPRRPRTSDGASPAPRLRVARPTGPKSLVEASRRARIPRPSTLHSAVTASGPARCVRGAAVLLVWVRARFARSRARRAALRSTRPCLRRSLVFFARRARDRVGESLGHAARLLQRCRGPLTCCRASVNVVPPSGLRPRPARRG